MNERVLIAYVAGQRIALPASQAHSVIEIDSIAPVPRAPAYVKGITALRSRALTVIDCRLALGLTEGESQCEQAIVAERENHLYALQVDHTEDVVEQQGELAPVPGSFGAGWTRVACGMAETIVGPALLVDLGRIIAGPQSQAA